MALLFYTPQQAFVLNNTADDEPAVEIVNFAGKVLYHPAAGDIIHSVEQVFLFDEPVYAKRASLYLGNLGFMRRNVTEALVHQTMEKFAMATIVVVCRDGHFFLHQADKDGSKKVFHHHNTNMVVNKGYQGLHHAYDTKANLNGEIERMCGVFADAIAERRAVHYVYEQGISQ